MTKLTSIFVTAVVFVVNFTQSAFPASKQKRVRPMPAEKSSRVSEPKSTNINGNPSAEPKSKDIRGNALGLKKDAGKPVPATQNPGIDKSWKLDTTINHMDGKGGKVMEANPEMGKVEGFINTEGAAEEAPDQTLDTMK